MNGSIVRQLILKDLYLMRWIDRRLASLAAGRDRADAAEPASRPTSAASRSSACSIILNILLVMSGVVQERKDKVLLFILSLPISTTQYIAAKMVANAIAFVGAVAGADGRPPSRHRRRRAIPNGILPFRMAVLGYLLCLLLRAARGRRCADGFLRLARHRRSPSATSRSTS